MRKVIAVGAALFVAAIASPAAGLQGGAGSARQADYCYAGFAGSAVDCEIASVLRPVVGALGAVGGSGIHYLPYHQLTSGPDGQPCVGTGYYPEGTPRPNEAPSIVPGEREPGDGTFSNLYQTYAPCPETPGTPASPGLTPEEYAARYWERIPLPKPAPYIAPGWGITGKDAYLETRGETRHAYTNDTPFGPLVITATGTYLVDWGDGQKSGPHSAEGKPWPDGEIRHEYTWAKSYDIVVTERWTATWSLAGRSGVLRELHTSGRIDAFPVRQIQAVISR